FANQDISFNNHLRTRLTSSIEKGRKKRLETQKRTKGFSNPTVADCKGNKKCNKIRTMKILGHLCVSKEELYPSLFKR
ncbi:hypothetical protein TNIN_69451, partial [Trichonephila inaurata madagascariensis]